MQNRGEGRFTELCPGLRQIYRDSRKTKNINNHGIVLSVSVENRDTVPAQALTAIIVVAIVVLLLLPRLSYKAIAAGVGNAGSLSV